MTGIYYKFKILLYLFFLLIPVFFSSCSNTKYLAKNQSLLVSSDLDLKSDLSASEEDELKNALTSPSIMLQHPNTKLLGLFRLKLWLYNQKNNEKKKGKIWKWLLIDKNMEPPVIYDSAKAIQSAHNMVSYLNNQGFFYASAKYRAKTKAQKTGLSYKVNTGKVFLIDSIGYNIPDTSIRRAIVEHSKQALIKKGDPFKVETLNLEQNRIADVVRNAGYYHFSDEDVQFVVDTINKSIFRNIFDPFANLGNYTVQNNEQPRLDITVQILNPSDSSRYKKYYIRHIYVYPDYSAYATPNSERFKEKTYEDLIIRTDENIILPRVLHNNIRFHKGDLYSQKNHSQTIQRLNSLGVWKFINVEMDTVSLQSDSLDCYIFLIPAKKQELGVNLEATSSSDYIIGGAINLNYQNNNIHHAANQLKVNLKSGVEWNSDSTRPFYIQAREFSGNANLSFPRFITPWKIKDVGKFSNPHTTLGLGASYLNRLGFFSLTNFTGSFGYDWNETSYKKWILQPFTLEYNRIFNISENFSKQLESNPFLKNSFSSVFIEGESASFIFNNQGPLHQKRVNYLQINVDESGLLLNGIDAIIRGVSGGNNSFDKLTSVNFSQYIKIDAEYKHYYNLKHSTLVSRIYGGVGVPYGNSNVLPYVKQFTAGGPNSMRGWRLRALGPGSYYNPEVNNPHIFPDQTGEMKLEGNLEYRFDIFKLFEGFMKVKGALFVDAGNIWNLKANPYKPGSEFKLARLYQDVAVDGGFGIRLDFSYAILRFDFATPFKVPYISDNYGWIIKTIHPFNSQWRRNNMVFNFAVGYPF